MLRYIKIATLYFFVTTAYAAGMEIPPQTLTKFGIGGHATASGVIIKTQENYQLPECGGNEFYIHPSNRGLHDNLYLLSTAWKSNSRVVFYVKGCFYNKTQVIAVSIVK